MKDDLIHDPSSDGVDRRGFLKCMAWAGTGVLWAVQGGVLSSCTMGENGKLSNPALASASFTFVQISDSHIGFSKAPNTDVIGTLRETIARVNGLPKPPAFVLHTGDLTHLATPEEFDTVAQLMASVRTEKTFYVPGEHDVFTDSAATYLERYGKGTRGNGYYSFDYNGVHFIGLVNVMDLKSGGLGMLGREQLEWLEKDVAGPPSSTSIVVFAHVPLWTIYPEWGWGTQDSQQALSYLKRFASVTVLNGHIHQVMQKVEGNITFHTARSTAFPQPAPGTAPSPGPMKNVAADQLRSMLGLATVDYRQRATPLAIVDTALG